MGEGIEQRLNTYKEYVYPKTVVACLDLKYKNIFESKLNLSTSCYFESGNLQ